MEQEKTWNKYHFVNLNGLTEQPFSWVNKKVAKKKQGDHINRVFAGFNCTINLYFPNQSLQAGAHDPAGDSHMEVTGVIAVPLKGQKSWFGTPLGC